MKKLFVFDFDGTLVDDKRELSPNTVNSLKKAVDLGHEVAICTGRSIGQLTKYLDKLDFIKIIATVNGGIINYMKENKQVILSSPLKQDVITKMILLAQKYRRELQWTTSDQKHYRVYFGNDPKQDITDESFFKIGTMSPTYDKWNDVQSTLITDEVIHLAMKIENSKIKEPFDEIYNEFYLTKKYNVVQTGGVYIDVDSYGTDKWTAVKYIQNHFNISNEETYCFGDSDNDISMVKHAKYGIALEHATAKLKENADIIIGDNNSNAISDFIEKTINNASNKKHLVPSLLAFDVNNIDKELNELIPIDISYIHYDVMDDYVKNKSFDNEWIDLISQKGFSIILHFMVWNPIKWIDRFINKNIYAITFQFEPLSFSETLSCIRKIKSLNIKAGIAIKPSSNFSEYSKYLKYVDFVTVMTVEPGKGGQEFNDAALENLQKIYGFKQVNLLNYEIEVDGGIKIHNVSKVLPYCNFVVSGTGFMKLNKLERLEFIKKVK